MKATFRYSAEVLRILDGDTIEVSLDLGFYLRSRLVLRLAGVNTMELRDKDQDKRVNAVAARNFVDDLIGGKSVVTETIKPHDKYGRYLARVYLDDGRCLNDLLLEHGLAEKMDA